MLTSRGEHFYFLANMPLYLLYAPSPGRRSRPQNLSWRDRLSALRNVRPLLRMVWETSPPLVLATVLLRLLRALLPLAMLWVSKLILDAVVARISRGSGQSAARLEAGCAGIGPGGPQRRPGTGEHSLRQPAGGPLHERVSVRLMEHATASIWLPSKIRCSTTSWSGRAARPPAGMGLLAALLNICQDTMSLLSRSRPG